MMMAIIVVLILLILAAGGFYYYQMMAAQPAEEVQTDTTTDNSELDSLNEELDSVQITDPEGDLMEIDQQIITLDASSSASASPSARIDR